MTEPVQGDSLAPPTSPTRVAPPTDEQVLDEAQFGDLVSWPKVVGIVSIVWGSLGLLGGVCGGISILFLPTFMGAQYDANNLPPTMVFGPVKLGMLLGGLILTAFLLFAGIATLRRLEFGRTAHLVYAWASLPLIAINLWQQWADVTALELWIRENPKSPFAQGGTTGGYIGLVAGLVLGLAWPMFTLIWFGLAKRQPGAMKQLKS